MNQPILHVDMTPDPDLPARVLRAYRANCDVLITAGTGKLPGIMNQHQRQRALLFDKAIAALERSGKVSQGMTAARRKGRAVGRPVSLSALVPVVRKLLRQGLSGAEIARRLAGKASAPWVYGTIRGFRNG